MKPIELKPWSLIYDNPRDYLINYFAENTPTTEYKKGGIQCLKGCNRSFCDLYDLTVAAFPNIRPEEVAAILTNLVEDDNIKISALFCADIKEIVYCNSKEFDWVEDYSGHISNDSECKKIGKESSLCYNDIIMLAQCFKQN